jgi:hypothetical protein
MAREGTLTARKIIHNAYLVLGVKKFGEVVSGEEAEIGLDLFNELLESFSQNGLLIPYREEISFTMTPNQGVYTISDTVTADITARPLARLDYVSFQIDDVIYPCNILTSNGFYQNFRVQDLASLPYNVLLQKATYQSELIFYPVPDRAYTCTVRGKFKFADVELDDRLDELPDVYRRFMRYAVARELCEAYGVEWSSKNEAIYQELLRTAESSNDIDLTIGITDSASLAGSARVLSGIDFL